MNHAFFEVSLFFISAGSFIIRARYRMINIWECCDLLQIIYLGVLTILLSHACCTYLYILLVLANILLVLKKLEILI
jgi:hypothetical protein